MQLDQIGPKYPRQPIEQGVVRIDQNRRHLGFSPNRFSQFGGGFSADAAGTGVEEDEADHGDAPGERGVNRLDRRKTADFGFGRHAQAMSL